MRSTTRVPSGERAAPVTGIRPAAPSGVTVVVLGRESSPTFCNGTGSSLFCRNGPVGTKISAFPRVFVMMIGVPSSAMSNASASRGWFCG